jgi:hypothetical protein
MSEVWCVEWCNPGTKETPKIPKIGYTNNPDDIEQVNRFAKAHGHKVTNKSVIEYDEFVKRMEKDEIKGVEKVKNEKKDEKK